MERVANASRAASSGPSSMRWPPCLHGEPGGVMQPWVGLRLGVMSKVGSRAAKSRISSVISSTEAEVPMASGTSRWRPPLVERSVTVTPPHWVTQLIACAMSASTAAWLPRLVSKSIGSSCVRRLVYKCTAQRAGGQGGAKRCGVAEFVGLRRPDTHAGAPGRGHLAR